MSRIALGFLCVGLAACQSSKPLTDAQTAQAGPRIVFVHLRLYADHARVVDADVRPGTLKRKRTQDVAGPYRVDVISPAGDTLWSEGIDDPLVRNLESEDPDHPGTIVRKAVHLDSGDVTVRVPYDHPDNRFLFRPTGRATTNAPLLDVQINTMLHD